jgi:hypothetical protein
MAAAKIEDALTAHELRWMDVTYHCLLLGELLVDPQKLARDPMLWRSEGYMHDQFPGSIYRETERLPTWSAADFEYQSRDFQVRIHDRVRLS